MTCEFTTGYDLNNNNDNPLSGSKVRQRLTNKTRFNKKQKKKSLSGIKNITARYARRVKLI